MSRKTRRARIEPPTKPPTKALAIRAHPVVATRSHPVVVAESLLQRCADELNRDQGLIKRQTYLVTGRRLKEIQKVVGYGFFGHLFKSHPNPIARPVHFTQRTANMLMRIASNDLLTDPKWLPTLPHSWRVAYELAKLPLAKLLEALETPGAIHPEMHLHEVRYLKGIPKPEEPDDPEAEAKRRIREAEYRIKTTIAALWSRFRGQRGFLVQLVRDLEIAEQQATEEIRRVVQREREQTWEWNEQQHEGP